MARVEITVDDRQVLDLLGELMQRVDRPGPVLKLIGETLVGSTKRRFSSSKAPDGTAWKENTALTVDRYLARYSGVYKKSGELSAAGERRKSGKKPLIGESRALGTTINYRVEGDTLYVGSPMEYAGTQQFGARRGAYGRTRRGSPIPLGDIPARPFLGLSDDDRREVLEILREHLAGT